ncbi:unnamed protein product [Calypogeia fissa]
MSRIRGQEVGLPANRAGIGNVDSSIPVEEVLQHLFWRNFTGSYRGRDEDHCSRCGNKNTSVEIIKIKDINHFYLCVL